VGALGVVYGDIGTSPLYTLRECFHGARAMDPSPTNVLGILSLVLWSLIGIVCVKYLTFVLRADNRGEGGVLSLLALAYGEAPKQPGARPIRPRIWLLALGVFGAALLYGDGMITPAISVLSAMEGIEVASPALTSYVVPVTVAVLIALFAVQRHGTGGVGRAFGPVTFCWFVALAALGIRGIWGAPQILQALSPHHAIRFLLEQGGAAFVVLGSVFLAVTGAEALYADLGHFGARAIRRAWFAVVFPALILNYLGQGALLLSDPTAAENPFYRLAPAWSIYPLVGLATAAAIIASQALISGAYSITKQAVQLGYLPRMEIRHTSEQERGQIYLPLVNWLLLLACCGLVLGFQSSSRLAAAYGIAVTLTMAITTVLFYFAARRLWDWSVAKAGFWCGLFLLIELAFFGANAVKIAHGGWFPLVIGLGLFAVMTTWKAGRKLLGERLAAAVLPLDLFVKSLAGDPPARVKGTAVFMSGNPTGTPLALLHNLKHNRVLHERALLLTLSVTELAHVSQDERLRVEALGEGLYRVVGRYGFLDTPSVPEVLRRCALEGLNVREEDTTFFLSRETILASARPGLARWRKMLFSFMARNAQPATTFFHLPANRVVELGMQVEL